MECDGASICKHDRQRSECKECDGVSGYPSASMTGGCLGARSAAGLLSAHTVVNSQKSRCKECRLSKTL